MVVNILAILVIMSFIFQRVALQMNLQLIYNNLTIKI